MQISSDPNAPPVDVHWFFCDADASPFPGWHRFGSGNWANEKEGWTGPGEVEGAPRPWRNGKKPAGGRRGTAFDGPFEYFQVGQPNPVPQELVLELDDNGFPKCGDVMGITIVRIPGGAEKLVDTIIINADTGLDYDPISGGGEGEARLALLAATESQWGVVTTEDQLIGGHKTFANDVTLKKTLLIWRDVDADLGDDDYIAVESATTSIGDSIGLVTGYFQDMGGGVHQQKAWISEKYETSTGRLLMDWTSAGFVHLALNGNVPGSLISIDGNPGLTATVANPTSITVHGGIVTAVVGGGGGGSYTDEDAQDAVANMLQDTGTIGWSYDDALNQMMADLEPDSIQVSHLDPAIGFTGDL